MEVLGLPLGVDEELLFLYFENKRRSGGGPLVSVEKKGDTAILLFEEAAGKWKHRGCLSDVFCKPGHKFVHLICQPQIKLRLKSLMCNI